MSHELRLRDESIRDGLSRGAGGGGASVMLATIAGAPLGAESIRVAVAAAADSGGRLVVVTVVDMPVGGRGPRIDLGDPPDLARSLNAAVLMATSIGVPVTTVRVPTLHPVASLAALAADRRPGLLVVGPDLERLSRLRHMSMPRYRRVIRALERRTSCLLWTPALEPLPPAAAPRRSRALPALIAPWRIRASTRSRSAARSPMSSISPAASSTAPRPC